MSVKVTHHSKGGRHVGYKKMVGGRLFHLITGTSELHRRRAERVAEALVACWKRLIAVGHGWTDNAIVECFRAAGEFPPSHLRTYGPAQAPTDNAAAEPAKAPDGGSLLHDCMDRFKLKVTKRFENKELDDDSHFQALQLIEKCKEAMENKPINTITKNDIDNMRGYWTKRPLQKVTKTPLAIPTVRHLIRTIKSVLNYCLRYESWTPPEFWEDSFTRLNVKNMLTLQERADKKRQKPKSTVEALQLLWHQAVPAERLYLGLGLFAGHGSEEIATLLKSDVVVETDGVYIERVRHKTGVLGRWWLPPEVAELLLARTKKTPDNSDGLALLGKRGMPLVHRGADGRRYKTDSVSQAWNRLRRRCAHLDIKLLPFKYLRKTGSQWVRNRLGLEYSQVFLAHECETVAQECYNDPEFVTLSDGMKAIYAERKKMFEKVNWDEWKNRVREPTGAVA